MANTTINTRIVLRNDTASNWAKSTLVPLKGEMCIESDTTLFKFGDGVHVYKELDYATMTPEEIADLIGGDVVHSVSMSTGDTNGTVKIEVDGVTSEIAVKGLGSAAYTEASAYAPAEHGTHVTYGTTTPNMDGTASAGTANSVSRSDHRHPTDTTRAAKSDLDTHTGNSTIHITSAERTKWNNKQDALTIDSELSGSSTNPIQNKAVVDGLNKKAPLASPAFTGTPTAPTANLGTNNTQIATTAFVNAVLASGIAVSDAMVFKGTWGTGGTITALPTSTVTVGDTYKVITPSSIPQANSHTGQAENVKVGDLVVAMADTPKWIVVPSGDENETFVKYAKSGVTLSTTAQSGTVVFGEAAIKQIDTSITDSSTSTNLPTTKSVSSYVGTKTGALQDSINTVSGDLSTHTSNKSNPHAVTKAQVGLGSVDNTPDASKNVNSAKKWTTARTLSLTGGVTASASVDGSANVSMSVTDLNTDYLVNGQQTLVLNCGNSNT